MVLGERPVSAGWWRNSQSLAVYEQRNACGFAILDNHLHGLLRLNLARAKAWWAEEVVSRWIERCPLLTLADTVTIKHQSDW
jgi:hypothetical protein